MSFKVDEVPVKLVMNEDVGRKGAHYVAFQMYKEHLHDLAEGIRPLPLPARPCLFPPMPLPPESRNVVGLFVVGLFVSQLTLFVVFLAISN
jgi:hypothetical protein